MALWRARADLGDQPVRGHQGGLDRSAPVREHPSGCDAGEVGRRQVPVIFARIDDPEHNRLRRMMTRDFTFRRAEAMRPQIQESGRRVPRRHDRQRAARRSRSRLRAAGAIAGDLVAARRALRDHEFFQHHSAKGLDARSTDEEKLGGDRRHVRLHWSWPSSRNANRATT